MKRYALSTLFLILASCTGGTQKDSSKSIRSEHTQHKGKRVEKKRLNHNITLAISVKADRAGIPVLYLALRNTGDVPFLYSLNAFTTMLTLTVKNAAGQTIPLSEFGTDLAEINYNVGPNTRPAILEPAATGGDSFPIDTLFRATPDTEYTLQVHWKLWLFDSIEDVGRWAQPGSASGKLRQVESNVITFRR